SGPKHGYAIMTDVAAFSGGRMEPGTLYGALSRLERRGWVRPLDTAGRRRRYEIAATWPCRAGQGGAADRARRPRPRAAAAVDRPHCIHYNLVSGTDEWGDVHAREVRRPGPVRRPVGADLDQPGRRAQ